MAELIRPEIPPMPVPGERVGDFGLEEAIGAGGMGAVFRAIDIKLDRPIALKILPPDQAVDPDVVQRYYQEGRAAARLDHENIARVYSIGHDGRYHYIAFEYIEGITIRQRVEANGPLPVGEAINDTLQIANALVHSSSRGVVHRDIKPSNIIVTPQGRAKLVDMGLARRFERGEDSGLTQSGMTLGTFDYISPEQARDPRDVDVRGDLYSLGCTLFHMLSGRPPFPEGTVLQKLLQHQEEAPPDIRKLNPAVPDELAAILVKLMAKDRDRRYQTPELLIRDLLAVAGSLGLRSINPEGLVWMAPTRRPAPPWARQLVWGAPALAFLLILGAMALWGDGTVPPPPAPSLVDDPLPTGPTPRTRPPIPPTAPIRPTSPVPDAPREYAVDSRSDLLRELLEAPPRSTILLLDKGPYDLRGAGSRLLKGLNLTLRAEAGVRPVIRLARGPEVPGISASTALLDLVGGRLTIDGVDFLIEGADPSTAIRAEDVELVVRRCGFRHPAPSTGRARTSAIESRAKARSTAAASGERGGSLLVESSEFDGGQVAISTSGPVEVTVRDCTFGPVPADLATIWAENFEPGSSPAEFRVAHVSVLAGVGPVFRVSGIAPKLRVSDSAFAPPSSASPASTLVAIDSPDRLDWRGVDNLYGRFSTYLLPLRGAGSRPAIKAYDAWADDPAVPLREAGSTVAEGNPWEEPNPLDTPAARAIRAFQLALTRRSPSRPGSRQGPTGPLPAPVVLATPSSSIPVAAEPPRSVEPPVDRRPRPAGESTRAREVASVATPPSAKPKLPALVPDDPMTAMPLTLPTEKPAKVDDPDGPTGAGDMTPMPMPVDPERPSVAPIAAAPKVGPPAPPVSPSSTAEPRVIRDPEAFREALMQPASGPGTRTLTLAEDADWILPACRVRGMANWVIRAERGANRPRIRFRPEPTPSGDSWTAWLTVEASGLRLEGIDLVLPAPGSDSTSPRRRAAFAILPGTIDLTLSGCSVTIEGDSSPSAVVALLAGELGGEGRLRVKDCFFRVGGDVIDVAGGRRLDLEVDNSAIASGGPMVHAHGLPPGRSAEELKLVLRQVTARVQGGLAQLQAAPGEPELPLATISAHDVILATGDPDAPLVRVDGQGDLDDLRPLVRWEGRSVGYHQISTYRRDQSARPGAVPTLYNREFWDFAVGTKDEFPIHGDLKFQLDPPPGRRPWTLGRDDLRLAPDSPAAGADLRDVPNPSAQRS